MTHRAALRDALRVRLEDTTLSPLWIDAMLNEALAGAIRAYGLRVPKQAATPVIVSAGVTELPMPAVIGGATRLIRLIDPRDRVVPAAAEDPAAGVVAQSWRAWENTLHLSQPAIAGTWRLEYLASRQIPATDLEETDIGAGDEELVLVLALAAALRQRAVDDGKRGARSEMLRLAEAARTEAAKLFAARQRRVRGGWLAAS
ncbi:MAG: hypothetical protein M3464_04570 [Chloroflexota bacterium]|nr:hypothetical protein [Chloroflexota bacterium]